MQIAVRARRHDRTRQASRRDRELGTYALLRDVTSIPAVSSIDYTSESTLNEQRYTLQEKGSFSAVESRNQYHTRTRKRFPFDMTVDSRNESEIQNTHTLSSLAQNVRSINRPDSGRPQRRGGGGGGLHTTTGSETSRVHAPIPVAKLGWSTTPRTS
jgi:hypothetical protein